MTNKPSYTSPWDTMIPWTENRSPGWFLDQTPYWRPRALDLFCSAGGASVGLRRAGFDVMGVDIKKQPRYPYRFIRADAFDLPVRLQDFDFIWASPHCQPFTALRTREDMSAYPNQIPAVRAMLEAAGVPFVIENVVGAPLRADLMLCANAFGLRCYRHRIFECSFPVAQPDHPPHRSRVNRRGENRMAHWRSGGHITITGDVGSYVGPEAMGIDWMTGNELSQAIPPAYSEYIGKQAIQFIRQRAAA